MLTNVRHERCSAATLSSIGEAPATGGHAAMGPRAPWRAFAAAVLCAILALGAIGLVGCGAPTPEDAIRASLSQALDGIKNRDEASLEELAVDMDVDRLSEYGIDEMEFMRAYFDGFDYSIDDIVVDEATATATVTLQCRSFSQYRDALAAGAQELVGDRSKLASLSNDEVNAAYGALIIDRIGGIENAPTAPFSITYELDDSSSTWEPANAVGHEVASAVLTN